MFEFILFWLAYCIVKVVFGFSFVAVIGGICYLHDMWQSQRAKRKRGAL